jgi:hypothetical protein
MPSSSSGRRDWRAEKQRRRLAAADNNGTSSCAPLLGIGVAWWSSGGPSPHGPRGASHPTHVIGRGGAPC